MHAYHLYHTLQLQNSATLVLVYCPVYILQLTSILSNCLCICVCVCAEHVHARVYHMCVCIYHMHTMKMQITCQYCNFVISCHSTCKQVSCLS